MLMEVIKDFCRSHFDAGCLFLLAAMGWTTVLILELVEYYG